MTLWALTFTCLATEKKIRMFNPSEVQNLGEITHWPNL